MESKNAIYKRNKRNVNVYRVLQTAAAAEKFISWMSEYRTKLIEI